MFSQVIWSKTVSVYATKHHYQYVYKKHIYLCYAICILLLCLSKLHKCAANQQHHTYTAHTLNYVNKLGWSMIPRPSLFSKNTQRHRCSRYDTNTVKVDSDFRSRSPAIARWHQQRNSDFCNVHHREQLRYFMGPSNTIWPRTLFSVRYRSFVIFASFTDDCGLKQSNLVGFKFYICGSVHRNSRL